jgi:hypothetical protein
MLIEYNDTQSISTNIQNTDTPSTAWISNIVNGEFPDRDLGVNYTQVETAPDHVDQKLSPWDYVQYCINCT